jgi:SecD/SecF fusion protein
VATSFCTLLPVVSLLLFGGETLKDFAFALMVGIASGAYSSIFIASPVLTHWKEREPIYRSRRARIVRELGAVPAYATALAGEPVDVEPSEKRKRTRRGGLVAPEEPGEQISRDEFQELVRDLDVDGEPSAPKNGGRSSSTRRSGAAGVAQKPPRTKPREQVEPELEQERQPPPAQDPTADLTPEDLVMKDDPKPRAKRSKRTRNRRHGRR